ncbi:unnamed protein product [Rhizophagus irregularis]|nr:unnamed protein product [Rhizophagus irregularis]CAB5101760.1 unnamed protein product [Rhizophagus irregularis]
MKDFIWIGSFVIRSKRLGAVNFHSAKELVHICWCWFLCSTDLAELEIPIDYDELDKILKVARIILQIKKLLNKTILGYKIS